MASWISTLLSRLSADRAGYLDELGSSNIPADVDALTTAVGKVPKSDGTVSWNSTALGAIQDEAEDALEGENIDHLAAVTTVAADMTAEVVDGSVISRMLSKTSDTSSYDPTTDAQEMLSDKLGAFSGDGGAAQDDSVKASLDLAHTDLDAIIGYVDELESRLTAARAGYLDELAAANIPTDIDTINTKLGTNADAAGTTTVFARLAQIVTTYLADGTIGLAAIKAYVDGIESELANGTYGLAALETLVDDLETEVAKIPKSDGAASWNATALAAILAQGVAAIVDGALDHMAKTADGAGNYPASVVDQSIVSKMLSKVAGGDTSSYDNTTDALEAIRDNQDDEFKSMLDLSSTPSTILMTGAEQDFFTFTPTALSKFEGAKFDLSNLADTRAIRIRVYEKIKSGGAYVKASDDTANTYTGAQDPALKRIDGSHNRYGMKITLEQTVVGAGYINVDGELITAAPTV